MDAPPPSAELVAEEAAREVLAEALAMAELIRAHADEYAALLDAPED